MEVSSLFRHHGYRPCKPHASVVACPQTSRLQVDPRRLRTRKHRIKWAEGIWRDRESLTCGLVIAIINCVFLLSSTQIVRPVRQKRRAQMNQSNPIDDSDYNLKNQSTWLPRRRSAWFPALRIHLPQVIFRGWLAQPRGIQYVFANLIMSHRMEMT